MGCLAVYNSGHGLGDCGELGRKWWHRGFVASFEVSSPS